MKPSYEQLEAELGETKKQLEETNEQLKRALEEIADLKERLNLNFRNSSKPPSTDRKANTPAKEPKKRKPRKGTARAIYPSERVDLTIEWTREQCPHCGSRSIGKTGEPEAIQQAELPEVRVTITEYRLHKYTCGQCGRRSGADLWGLEHSMASLVLAKAPRKNPGKGRGTGKGKGRGQSPR